MRLRRGFLEFLASISREYSDDSLNPVAFGSPRQRMYLVLDPVQIKQVLQDSATFTRTMKYMNAFRAVMGYNLVSVPNDEWKPLRRRTGLYFSGEKLRDYGREVVGVLRERALPALEEKARSGQPVDLFDEMLDVASLAVFRSFLGVGAPDPPRSLCRSLNAIFCYVRANMFSFWLPPLWVPTADNRNVRGHLEAVRRHLLDRIATARHENTVFADIIRAHTDEHGTPQTRRILDETISNLVGGTETTIILMTWAVYYALRNPDVLPALYEEIDDVLGSREPTVDDLRRMPHLGRMLDETLRLRPPAYVLSRVATRDTVLGDYAIEEGAMLFASQFITHRDPRVWNEPERFDPDRFRPDSPEAFERRRGQMPFFPFGGGSFSCIGMKYAVNEAGLMMTMLMQKFDLRLEQPRDAESPGIDARLTLRPDRPIRVRVGLRRQPAPQSCAR